MKLLTALLLNTLLLLTLLWWLRREYRGAAPALRRWLLPALGWRVLLTGIGGSWPSPDAQNMSFWSQGLTAEFWARPGTALALWQGDEIRAGGQLFTKYALSNTLFFIKLLALLNLASLGSLLLNALYLSLFCFVGCWLLARSWVQSFAGTPPGAAVVALLLWPSVVWWTASIGKETVLVGSEAAMVALVLRLLYGPVRNWLRVASTVAATLALAWLAYRMRYFFALPLAGSLAALAVVRLSALRGWLGQRPGVQAGSLVLLLALGGGLGLRWAVGQVSEGFYTNQLYEQYVHGLATSVGRPHVVHAGLAPTGASLVHYAPAAIGQVLTRPWLGESGRAMYVGAGLENLLLLGLAGLAAVALVRGRAGRLPLVVAALLLIYCLLLAAFIGLSTPNLGTLHRYRAALLPWLLLLLLQNDYARASLRRLGLAAESENPAL